MLPTVANANLNFRQRRTRLDSAKVARVVVEDFIERSLEQQAAAFSS